MVRSQPTALSGLGDYYDKVVEASNGEVLPEDADELMDEIRQRLDQGTEEFKRMQADSIAMNLLEQVCCDVFQKF